MSEWEGVPPVGGDNSWGGGDRGKEFEHKKVKTSYLSPNDPSHSCSSPHGLRTRIIGRLPFTFGVWIFTCASQSETRN